MRPNDLLSRLEDEPFRAFRVHLTDGTVLEVRQPRMVIVGRSTAVLPTRFSKDEDGNVLAERWRTIDLLLIVQFSDLDENGHGRRRKKRYGDRAAPHPNVGRLRRQLHPPRGSG